MAKKLTELLLLLFAISQLAAACPGTETGNPGNPTAEGGGTESYQNDDFGVSVDYDNGWTVSEVSPVDEGVTGDAPADCPTCEVILTGIDTSSASSTQFGDGTTTVTLFYVTLDEAPPSLLEYLQGVFSDRSFTEFANEFVSGFFFDNIETGVTGGDLQEYYFLDGTLLLYVVTDLFVANDGVAKAQTIIDSLRFD